jgi:hypothetical protein
MKILPLSKVYQLLEPGPVVLLTTAMRGQPNVMTMSWHMMVDFEPPLVACVVSSDDHSFAALRKTKECVIAVPSVAIADRVVKIGNCSGREVDKFAAFALAAKTAERVAAPLLPECFANLECRVAETRLVDKYNLFIPRWSRRGSPPIGRPRKRSTTAATVRSSWMERSLRSSRGCDDAKGLSAHRPGFPARGRALQASSGITRP